MNEYKVYMYAFPDGKRYIGMTKHTLRERRNYGYQHNEPLRQLVRKLKWNEYQHEILCDGLTKEEACEKEKYYIKLFDTTDPNKGYNISHGGNRTFEGLKHTEAHKRYMSELYKGKVFSAETRKRLQISNLKTAKSVICFDADRNIVKEYVSLNEAARAVNGHPTNVNRACASGRIYQNYFWAFAVERG